MSSHWGSALTSAGTPGPRGLKLSPGFLLCFPGALVLLAPSLGWMDVLQASQSVWPGPPPPTWKRVSLGVTGRLWEHQEADGSALVRSPRVSA